MNQKLKYRDERDKTYGLAGMAIAMVMADGEDMIIEISLDDTDGENLRLSPDFYFRGNPRYSAKLAWNQMLKQLSFVSGMLIGNVMCRSYLLDQARLSDEAVDSIRDFIRSEGADSCSLESDEADNIFRRNYNYYDRVFSHQQVAAIARDFADELTRRRTMSLHEILDSLRDLGRL